jgi:hypothetical protein
MNSVRVAQVKDCIHVKNRVESRQVFNDLMSVTISDLISGNTLHQITKSCAVINPPSLAL